MSLSKFPRWKQPEYVRSRKHRQVSAGYLRMVRERMGWSQERLARELGVTESTLNNWEQGKRVCPYPTLLRLALVAIEFKLKPQQKRTAEQQQRASEQLEAMKHADELLQPAKQPAGKNTYPTTKEEPEEMEIDQEFYEQFED